MSNNLVEENQDDPEELVSLYEERRRVLAVLDQLPQRCQLLLRRLYLDAEPATYAQLAEELRMPLNSVGPTRGRCIERLLELLEENASVKVLSKRNSTLVS
jgi:DNA-directed RNA polymerase specialized sigma24 family protein